MFFCLGKTTSRFDSSGWVLIVIKRILKLNFCYGKTAVKLPKKTAILPVL